MNDKEPWLRRLTLPAYQVKDAARYAGIEPRTVQRWQKEGKESGPAIASRPARQGLSWLKLHELAIVATWRTLGVKLQKIRDARDFLATYLGAEFPFSHHQVVTDGQDIIMRLGDLDDSFNVLIANKGGQYAWTDIIGNRFAEFDYDKDRAVRWRIFGNSSGVILDPRIAFGAPTVRGVPTWAVLGRYKAGEVVAEIADDFRIGKKDVEKALAFEGIAIQ